MKKRGQRKFNNRLLYTLITFGIMIAISVGIYAYGTSTPSVFGHSYSEIQACGANQVLRMNSAGTAWVCGEASGSARTAVYVDNPLCGGSTILTTSSTCATIQCGNKGINHETPLYFHCDGSCNDGSSYEHPTACTRIFVGYLV
jgi:hypothetical protein